MRKKILIIPHIPFGMIKVREEEIAKELSKTNDVHYLTWTTSHSKNVFIKIKNTLTDIFACETKYRNNNLTVVKIPMLHRPLWCAKYINRYFLEKYIEKNNFDILINASLFSFSISKKCRQFKYIFDFVDLPAENTKSGFGKFVMKHIHEEVYKADEIIACSQGLIDYTKKLFGKGAVFIPNGTSLEKFKSVDKTRTEIIRNKYGLQNKIIVGCISNYGHWTNLGFLINVFRRFKNEVNDAALLLVGPGPLMEYYKKITTDEDIIFAGAVPHEDLYNYFSVLDVAVVPNKKNLFQDMAFHIKIIEYTAAKKIIVSSPLQEVVRINFPNIIIADLREEEWVKALKKACNITWDKKWNEAVLPYDWKIITKKLEQLF